MTAIAPATGAGSGSRNSNRAVTPPGSTAAPSTVAWARPDASTPPMTYRALPLNLESYRVATAVAANARDTGRTLERSASLVSCWRTQAPIPPPATVEDT